MIKMWWSEMGPEAEHHTPWTWMSHEHWQVLQAGEYLWKEREGKGWGSSSWIAGKSHGWACEPTAFCSIIERYKSSGLPVILGIGCNGMCELWLKWFKSTFEPYLIVAIPWSTWKILCSGQPLKGCTVIVGWSLGSSCFASLWPHHLLYPKHWTDVSWTSGMISGACSGGFAGKMICHMNSSDTHHFPSFSAPTPNGPFAEINNYTKSRIDMYVIASAVKV